MSERRHASYWEEHALPDPPAPPHLPERTDVLIVGAGFMGRWLAYFLSRTRMPGTGRGGHPCGPRILVVERDRFTYGASSRNAGFLTCGQVSEMLADVATVGMEAVVDTFRRRLRGIEIVRREFPDLDTTAWGSLDWDPLTDAKRDLAAALNAAAGDGVYRVRTARMERDERPAMFNTADGALNPVGLLRSLRERSAADFAFGVHARRVSDGVAVLEVGGPDAGGPGADERGADERVHELRYDRAFICTNAFTAELHPGTGVRPGRGQILVTTPVATAAPRTLGYLNDGYDYFRFVGDRLLIGGGRHRFDHENGPTELEPTPEVGEYLVDVARRVIGHADFRVEHHWAGIMGFHNGRHLGGTPRHALDDVTEVVAGFGGMGVALTPVTALEVTRDMMGSR